MVQRDHQVSLETKVNQEVQAFQDPPMQDRKVAMEAQGHLAFKGRMESEGTPAGTAPRTTGDHLAAQALLEEMDRLDTQGLQDLQVQLMHIKGIMETPVGLDHPAPKETLVLTDLQDRLDTPGQLDQKGPEVLRAPQDLLAHLATLVLQDPKATRGKRAHRVTQA